MSKNQPPVWTCVCYKDTQNGQKKFFFLGDRCAGNLTLTKYEQIEKSFCEFLFCLQISYVWQRLCNAGIITKCLWQPAACFKIQLKNIM